MPNALFQLFGSPTPLFSWLCLLACAVFVCLLVVVLPLLLRVEKGLAVKLILITTSTAIAITLIEGALRWTGLTINYSEKRLGHYHFLRHGSFRDSLHVWPPNEKHILGDPNIFQYHRITNSLGISDVEPDMVKPDSVIRIVALGDSFTEGDGAPADSSWPQVLNHKYEKAMIPVEVINAGVCGSDPFHELMLLQLRLADYKPDLAIITISLQDLYEDCAVRGGMGRFDPSSGNAPKVMEILYAYSHLARLVYNRLLGYSWQLIREDEDFRKEMVMRIIPEMFQLFADVHKQNPEMKIVPVYYPHQHNLYNDDPLGLTEALKETADRFGFPLISLRPCYRDMIEAAGDDYTSYWWRNDGHHNSKGYEVMASCINEALTEDINRLLEQQEPN